MPITPDFLGRWLPASLLTALNQTARQMGAVLGVALLVSILGTPTSPAEAMEAFEQVWVMCAGAAVLSAGRVHEARRGCRSGDDQPSP